MPGIIPLLLCADIVKIQKRDPPATRKICIITLTNIFLLTHEHQSLVREITTPSLPSFITSCISIVKADAYGSLTEFVLQALAELIRHHPTSFRPFADQIRSLILPLIASTPSRIPRRSRDDESHEQLPTTSEQLARSARFLLILLNVCAPKNTSGEEWAKSLQSVIDAAHRTANLVFRAVPEDWEPSTTRPRTVTDPASYAAIVSDESAGPLDLPKWRGIHAGIERLDGLLQTLHAFIATPTSMAVSLPLGALFDVVNRLLSMLPPSKGRNPRYNPEISREEREGLWVELPRVHASTMMLVSILISRLGHVLAPASDLVLEQVLWVLENEHANSDIRKTTYELTAQILEIFGPSFPKTLSKSLSMCIKLCCDDLLPPLEQNLTNEPASTATTKKLFPNGSSAINADSYLKRTSNHPSISEPPIALKLNAAALLPLFLTHLPPKFLSFSFRTQIDRTAILTQNKKAMLASVLNPPEKRKGRRDVSSIMPVLARSFPGCMEVEALIRPRMPVLYFQHREEGEDESDEDETMEVEVPDTYATKNDENMFTLNQPTTSNSAQNLNIAEPAPAPEPHMPQQNPSQTSQPTTIPETQSSTSNPKKRDLDSASESQASAKPSISTSFEPALPQSFTSFEKTTEAGFGAKKPRLDGNTEITDPMAVQPMDSRLAVSETQGVQPNVAAAPLASVSTSQTAAPSPAPLVEKQGGGASSSDDEDFEIPAIDPTMDTDEEEDEENEDEE